MKISVVIPYYDNSPEKKELLQKCVSSLRGHDELLIIWNDGIGFAPAVNKGLELANGEYICVVNDDIELVYGNIRDMADPQAVTSPVLNERGRDFCGAFFCIPRWVYEKVGNLDERFLIGYYEDDDYLMRLRQEGIPTRIVDKVFIESKGGQTMKAFHVERVMAENRQRFLDKWGQLPEKGVVNEYELPKD